MCTQLCGLQNVDDVVLMAIVDQYLRVVSFMFSSLIDLLDEECDGVSTLRRPSHSPTLDVGGHLAAIDHATVSVTVGEGNSRVVHLGMGIPLPDLGCPVEGGRKQVVALLVPLQHQALLSVLIPSHHSLTIRFVNL